ncbi:hypothetical protein D3C81_1536690 [compost metagenome]
MAFQRIGDRPAVAPQLPPADMAFVPPARFSFSSIVYWGSACKETLGDIVRAVDLEGGELRIKTVPPPIGIYNSFRAPVGDAAGTAAPKDIAV